MRRPSVEYFPMRSPPSVAFSAVATFSTEMPRSAARARFGTIRSSGIPIR